MRIDFSGRTVLITGGSRGIGAACAKMFADAGANVIITYKHNQQKANDVISSLGAGDHKAVKLDVSDAEDVERVLSAVLNTTQVDVLVNNAGIFVEHRINEVSYSEWQQKWNETINTNLIGAANVTYILAQQMIRRRSGKIVNVSSRGAFRGEPDHPAYGASKAGLNAMSQSLAVALAPHNITVGVVAPGFVETDMAADYLQSEAGNAVKKQSPLNRVATAEEVARVVLMFAADGFEFMTGGIVDLNGASYLRS